MNREDIIRMAQEVGLYSGNPRTPGTGRTIEGRLLRFAALVAAHEREKVARFIMAQCFSTGRNDSIEGMLDALVRQVAEREREACAKVCDELLTTTFAAQAIRARGKNHE